MDRASFEAIYGKGTKLLELAWFLKELPKESERGQVLIVVAFLDDMLERLLRSFLPKHSSTKFLLKSGSGPISGFAMKSSLARSLGLINDSEYANIETLGQIRNKFAHAVECSFETEAICKLVAKLDHGLSVLDTNPSTKPLGLYRFTLVSNALLGNLHDRDIIVQRTL